MGAAGLEQTSSSRAAARPRAGRSAAWALAWLIWALGLAASGWVLATEVWWKQPEMSDRFLIPAASAVLLYYLRPAWNARPRRPRAAGLILVALGALLFPVGWYLLVQVGARTILLWWLFIALELAALGLLVLGEGWPRARLVLFPLLFALLALPTPDLLQKRYLLPGLKWATTVNAAAVLPWLGVPAVRNGYTLKLPTGELGVVDACSGALSLTALTAISILTAFVRHRFRRDLSLAHCFALVALTPVIVVLSNSLRVIITGLLKHYVGDWTLEGFWHDALGYLVILVGFGLIFALSNQLARPDAVKAPAEPPPGEPESSPRVTGALPWAVLALALALGGSLLAERHRQFHKVDVDLDALALNFPGWTGRAQKVEPDVAEMLKCDQILLREYEDARWGTRVQVYVMFWATPANTAYMHHPDICWKCRGWEQENAGGVKPIRWDPGQPPLEISVRHYLRDQDRQLIFYWSQNANQVLPDGQEPIEQVNEYAWIWAMLTGRQEMKRVSRLSVLLGTEVPLGRPADQEPLLADLTSKLAADLYRICPWAKPASAAPAPSR